MKNYKFRISGENTNQDLVKEHIRHYIGDSIVGRFTSYSGPVNELGQQTVYGKLLDTSSSIDVVRANFKNAFDKYGYISSVDPYP